MAGIATNFRGTARHVCVLGASNVPSTFNKMCAPWTIVLIVSVRMHSKRCDEHMGQANGKMWPKKSGRNKRENEIRSLPHIWPIQMQCEQPIEISFYCLKTKANKMLNTQEQGNRRISIIATADADQNAARICTHTHTASAYGNSKAC